MKERIASIDRTSIANSAVVVIGILLLFIIGTIGFHLIETLYGESGTLK